MRNKNWKTSLEEQGFELEPEPTVEDLETWERDGGCETPCGCWVEPDGVCEHGAPSWMIILGFI